MKKMMTLLLAFALICSLAACGQNPDNNASDNATVSDNCTIAGGETEVVTHEFLYGKVTSIVGNEIEISLAAMPDMPDEGQKEESNADIPDGGMAAGVVPAEPAGSDVGDVGSNMEYTGETLTMTIPTGTKIYNMGQETTLSAVKKGGIITLVVDNLDDLNIVSLTIVA